MTESRLNVEDLSPFSELVPPECTFFKSPLTAGRGGGLASVFKRHFGCQRLPTNVYFSFELLLLQIESTNPVLCVLVYHPPKLHKDFISEFTDFLGDITTKYDRLLILGDFNIHVCCPSNSLANEFLNLIDSFNLVQSVTGSTHEHGHKSVVFEISLPRLAIKPCIAARCLRTVYSETINDFCTAYNDVFSSLNLNSVDLTSQLCAEELLFLFNSTCTNNLDSIAPLKGKRVKHKLKPWLNESTRALRQICRGAECKWKKDKLQISYEIFRDSLAYFQKVLNRERANYFSEVIEKKKSVQA